MKNKNFGSLKYLVFQIIVICLVGIILYLIFDLLLCKFITNSTFVYSIHSYII